MAFAQPLDNSDLEEGDVDCAPEEDAAFSDDDSELGEEEDNDGLPAQAGAPPQVCS